MNCLTKNIIQLSGKNIIFPFYHLISDDTCPHIQNLYPVKGIQKFKEELDFFQRYYEPISLEKIIHHIQNKTQAQKPSFFLSFDDGLKECHTVIAPILKKRNLSAAFFINTDFVDNKALFFRYKVSLLIEHLKSENSIFSKEYLLKMKYADSEKINQFAKDYEIDFELFLEKEKPYMNWEEIEDLHRQGFYLGAHSLNHPLYSEIPLEERLRQTQESTNELQQKLNLDYRIFSFPFTDSGVSSDFFHWMYQEGNMDLSFGTAGIKDDEFTHHLQRIPMDNNLGSTSAFILKHSLYYQLKKLFGKSKVSRS